MGGRNRTKACVFSHKPDGEKVPLSDEEVEREMSGRKRRQLEDLSRFRNVRSKPDQETVAASDKDVESKKCQGQRLPRDHGVNNRAS